MTVESALTTLTQETTALIETCTVLKDDVDDRITAAVIVSENAAQIPLVSMASQMIDTQTLVVQLITR
jgi:hypothetical protein